MVRGRPGSGKSTTLREVAARLQGVGVDVSGIITPEVRVSGSRVGFEVVDIASGERVTFASVRFGGKFRVSKYGVDVEAFERVAIPALERPSSVYLIDEVGKMELFSGRFREVVEALFSSNSPVVCSAPSYRLEFVERLAARPDTEVFWVRRGESARVARVIAERVLALLP
ncbi:MAG: nucleoside triphosphatase [Thermoproteota archaeon]|nr:MAG: nucleoside triphosphatase [Candidatus Korarchaeota archaeon]